MRKVQLFSEKLGKSVTIQSCNGLEGKKVSLGGNSGIAMMGWMKTGWSKDSSWKIPY